MTTLTRLCEKFEQLSIENKKENFSLTDVKKVINDEIQAIEKSREGKPKDVFQFGKYKGKKISDIATIDKPYLEWIIRQPWFKNIDEVKKFI